MRALLRGLRWAALGLGLVVFLMFGAFFFFVFEKEQQFWDNFERSRPTQNRVKLAEVPAALKVAVLFAEASGEGECTCASLFSDLYRTHEAGQFLRSSCSMENYVVRQATDGLWKGHLQRVFGSVIAICNLTSQLSRDEVLEELLNRAYFGDQQYGVSDGARYYFGKPFTELSLEEAAGLASIIRAPASFSPKSKPERYRERRDLVLKHLRSLPEFGAR